MFEHSKCVFVKTCVLEFLGWGGDSVSNFLFGKKGVLF